MIRFLFLLTFLTSISTRASIYVSPSGNDTTGTGTSDNPFATLQYAVLVAYTNGVHDIRLKDGSYYNATTIIKERDSGLAISADAGATPVLYGGQLLTGWTTNGIYQEATLPTFPTFPQITTQPNLVVLTNWQVKDLLVDNVRVRWARYPDYGSWKTCLTSGASSTTMHYTGTDIPDATIVANALLEFRWTHNAALFDITNLDTSGKVATIDPPSSYRVLGAANFPNQYATINTVEGMLACRWYHDLANNKIVVQTNSLAGKAVLVPTQEHILWVAGSNSSSLVSNIVISGLMFRGATCQFVQDIFGLEGGETWPAAIEGYCTTNILVTNCIVENVGGKGIDFQYNSKLVNAVSYPSVNLKPTVRNCTVRNCGAGGINVADGTVGGCVVSNVGTIYPSGAGIFGLGPNVTGVVNTYTNNAVSDVTYSGIMLRTGMNSLIAYNTVSNVVTVLDDGAWIYTGASGMTNQIIGNMLYGTSFGTNQTAIGIYFDFGSVSCSAISNITLNITRPFLSGASTNCVLNNNYFTSTAGALTFALYQVDGPVDHLTITNNLFSYLGSFQLEDTLHLNSFVGNLFYSPAGTNGVPSGATFGNPAMYPNFALSHRSEAITMGIAPIMGIAPYATIPTVRTGYIRPPQ